MTDTRFQRIIDKMSNRSPAVCMWQAGIFENGIFLEGESEYQRVLDKLKKA